VAVLGGGHSGRGSLPGNGSRPCYRLWPPSVAARLTRRCRTGARRSHSPPERSALAPGLCRGPNPGGIMNQFQWLYVAWSVAQKHGYQVALLVDDDQVVAYGVAANAAGSDTAVVNVLQNCTAYLGKKAEVYASYPITDMCWGMAWARRIDK